MYNTYLPLRHACQPVSGIHAGDLRYSNSKSVKGQRMRPGSKARVNVRTDIGVTSGYVTAANPPQYKSGKINTRHALRRMARDTQRRK